MKFINYFHAFLVGPIDIKLFTRSCEYLDSSIADGSHCSSDAWAMDLANRNLAANTGLDDIKFDGQVCYGDQLNVTVSSKGPFQTTFTLQLGLLMIVCILSSRVFT